MAVCVERTLEKLFFLADTIHRRIELSSDVNVINFRRAGKKQQLSLWLAHNNILQEGESDFRVPFYLSAFQRDSSDALRCPDEKQLVACPTMSWWDPRRTAQNAYHGGILMGIVCFDDARNQVSWERSL